ncbi:MAG: hypothetical protein HZB16_14385 [Armatimonadetes bacterium]|nr:hypothetical protein [Armatimonadota bacterium]
MLRGPASSRSAALAGPSHPWRLRLLAVALVLVVGFTGYRAVRVVRRVVYWRQHTDEPIRPWMNLGYVAHSYHVPPHILYQALDMPVRRHDRRSISRLAKARRCTTSTLIPLLEMAIVHARPPYPPPPPPPEAPPRGRAP